MENKDLLPSQKLALRLEERLELEKRWSDRVAGFLTSSFGTVSFLLCNVTIFFIWILINIGLIKGITPFDPFPFGLLTMVVSLEAIFLSVIVLISQNRTSKIADLRQELDFIVTLQAEEEITRILTMLDEVHDHLGLNPKDDKELTEMKRKIDINRLREILRRHSRFS